MKKIISLMLIMLLFLVTNVFAKEAVFKLENAEIFDKSEDVEINNFTYQAESVNADVTFHKINDYVIYKFNIKNTDTEDYVIKEIKDNNNSNNIVYEYEKYKDYKINGGQTLELKIKAVYKEAEKDIDKREKNDTTEIIIKYEDKENNVKETPISINSENENKQIEETNKIEKDTKENPKTGDRIITMVVMFVISTLGIIVLVGKDLFKKKKILSIILILGIILPLTVKAEEITNNIIISSKYRLNDKIKVTIDIDGNITNKVVGYKDLLDIQEPNIEGKNFEKWVLSDGSDFDITSKITKDLEIKAVLKDKVATLQAGRDALLTMLKQAGVNNLYWYFEEIDNIRLYYLDAENSEDLDKFYELELKKIKKATKEEYNSVKDNLTEENILSIEDSENVYTWYNVDEHTLYYYTEAKKIYLNEDSSYLFSNFAYLEELDLSAFDTSKVKNMQCMFDGCSSLTSIDVTNFDTSQVVNMEAMFANCYSVTLLDTKKFDTSNVENMDSMFFCCESLTSIDVTNFNTSKVKYMSGMFWCCSSLSSIDVTNFDTSKVINMASMFFRCLSLTELDLSNFDTDSVTNMQAMFCDCQKITLLDLSNFDTSSVTNMQAMLAGCKKITSLDVSNFNTSNVTNMCNMIRGCESLTSIDVTNFNTSNVTDMSGMFADSSSLTSIDVTNFDTSKVESMSHMFYRCPSLTELDLSSFNSNNLKSIYSMFLDDELLKTIYVSNNFGVIKNNYTSFYYVFRGCTSIVGGAGTTYNPNCTSELYARIDDPANGKPGYFTLKEE